MSELYLKVVNMSISASWLVLAVLLIRFLLKKAPKWVSVLLWGVVAVRLVCPISVESVFSLIPSVETVPPEIMMDPSPELHTGISSLNGAINPVITEAFAPQGMASMNPLQLWIPLAAVAWLVGIGVMLIYTAVSYILLRRRVFAAIRLRDNIYQSENVESPFVLGIIKPRIYLPFQPDSQAWEHIIAHEQAHIRRKDHWWKPLGFVLLALHWFNPLVWLSYILLCRDIELACDEKVIQGMDSEAKADYTQALVACSINRPRIAACPLAFGEVGVKERVRSVMNYRKAAFWVVPAALILCAVVAACFLTNPQSKEGADITGAAYSVEEVTFESGVYSYTVRAGINTPVYAITEDMHLLSQGEYGQESAWTNLGLLEESRLTEENFDSLFIEPGDWAAGENAKTIRQNATKTWQLIYNANICYYLLLLDNGEIYVAYGYTGPVQYGLRWLFKLQADSGIPTGMVASSGNETVPVMAIPAGTPIENYKTVVSWLTVNQDPGSLVPFRVQENGQERFGIYNAYDAETLAPLEFFHPSGLAPQTYIFENADPKRSYIVTLRFSMEEDAPIYAFGAKFDLSQVYSVETVFGGLKTYYKNSDGTWSLDGYTYQYRLAVTGRMHNAAVDSTFVFLSNLEDIPFERAWRAAGLSSNTADYFSPEEAVLVDWLPTGEPAGSYQKLTLEDVAVLSGKGYDLKISDFEKYHYTATGSGLYIRVYEIDQRFQLWIGSTASDAEPMYFYLTLAEDPEQRIDIRDGGVAEFINKHSQLAPIDEAVTGAILAWNDGDKFPDGQIQTESHNILGLATASGTPLAGQTNHMQETTVYVQYVYRRYVYADGSLELVGSVATPAVLTFTHTKTGYKLKEFWEPNGGDAYATDIRSKFPGEIADILLDPENDGTDVERLENGCLVKAQEYISELGGTERP